MLLYYDKEHVNMFLCKSNKRGAGQPSELKMRIEILFVLVELDLQITGTRVVFVGSNVGTTASAYLVNFISSKKVQKDSNRSGIHYILLQM